MSTLDPTAATMTTWYQCHLGQNIAHLEKAQLQRHTPKLYGSTLIQLGNSDHLNWVNTHPLMKRVKLVAAADTTTENPLIISSYQQLAFSNESIAAIILPHVFEFETTRHTILTECWRVLAAEGYLIILGFNPWSLWGVRRLFTWQPAAPPWNGHFSSMQTIRYQLLKLGANIKKMLSFCLRPPLENSLKFNQLYWLDTLGQLLFPYYGGIYLIVAQKQQIPLIPIKMRWQWQTTLSSKNLAEPTAGNIRRG